LFSFAITMFLFGMLFAVGHTAHAFGITDTITSGANDAKKVVVALSPIVVIIALVGVGLMYFLSIFPIFNEWKQNNPKAVTMIFMGLFFTMAASTISGLVVASGVSGL